MSRLRSALAAPAAALLALAIAPAASAAPAEGSVPSEVRAYVADGSLVHQLADVYGPGASGEGLDFDDTTKTGVIERVHVWSDALRNGEETDRYVELLNEWVVPVSIADEPVGLATIWINPATVAPELASFVRDADLAAALSEVPDGASLVHDGPSAAWLALAEDGTLTPLVPGTTGLSTPVPIDDVAILPAGDDVPVASGDPNTGTSLAIAVLAVLFAIIVVALIVPTIRKRKEPVDAEAAPSEEQAPAEETAAVEAAEEPAAIEAPKPKPKRTPKPKPAPEAAPAPED